MYALSLTHTLSHTYKAESCSCWTSSFSQAAVTGTSQTSGYYVHSDYGIESYMLFEADSTSASSLETDSGTSDKHLTRNGLGELP